MNRPDLKAFFAERFPNLPEEHLTRTFRGSHPCVKSFEEIESAALPPARVRKFFEKRVWWWRNNDNRGDSALFLPWKPEVQIMADFFWQVYLDYHQKAAWFYEFRARYNGRFNWDFGGPWPWCYDQEMNAVAHSIPPSHRPSLLLPTVRTPTTVKLEILVDAYAPEEDNVEIFRRMLAERKKKFISDKLPLPPKRTRPPKFTVIEALDLKRYANIVLSDGERGSKAKEQKEYLKLCKAIQIDP